jgi:FkbM family methyltransferase
MGIKRVLADFAEALMGTRIMLPGQVGLVYEEEHLKRFFDHFRIDCVFDVGANAGQYAEMLRTRTGYSGPIISFEPIPELAAILRAKAAATPNWFIEEVALDSSVRPASFNVMKGDQFSSLREPFHGDVDLFKDANSVARKIAITTSTLDRYYQKYKEKLDFRRPYLKLDTQGNDVAVVSGAGDIVREFAGMQSELAVRRLYDGAHDFKTALEFYHSKGFELSAFVPNDAGHFPTLLEIDCIMYRAALLQPSPAKS